MAGGDDRRTSNVSGNILFSPIFLNNNCLGSFRVSTRQGKQEKSGKVGSLLDFGKCQGKCCYQI